MISTVKFRGKTAVITLLSFPRIHNKVFPSVRIICGRVNCATISRPNIALLLIDFQNDYYATYATAKWALSGTEVAASKAARLLTEFRNMKQPVILVRHEFPSNDAPFFLPDSEGVKTHNSVTPLDAETAI